MDNRRGSRRPRPATSKFEKYDRSRNIWSFLWTEHYAYCVLGQQRSTHMVKRGGVLHENDQRHKRVLLRHDAETAHNYIKHYDQTEFVVSSFFAVVQQFVDKTRNSIALSRYQFQRHTKTYYGIFSVRRQTSVCVDKTNTCTVQLQ